MRFGRYFEEFQIGAVYRHWPGKTFHGDTVYGQTTVLDKRESESKDDRGVLTVETKGYKQDGTLICVFQRRVMVPKQSHAGPEMPSFPEPRG